MLIRFFEAVYRDAWRRSMTDELVVAGGGLVLVAAAICAVLAAAWAASRIARLHGRRRRGVYRFTRYLPRYDPGPATRWIPDGP